MRHVTATSDDAGQRLDNFLLRELKGVPRSHVYRLLRRGEVRVNKGRVKPLYRLKEKDVVRLPPVRVAERIEPKVPKLDYLEQAILHEDDRLLVLNKPAGLAVHGGSGLSYGVIEGLRKLRPDAPFLELVHRIDRDTSGCLLIAKKRSALRNLHEQMRAGQMHKHYSALLGGLVTEDRQDVRLPLRKHQLRSGERMVEIAADEIEGQSAHSRFTVQTRFRTSSQDASLIDVRLFTGRTHQIRVHAKAIGHPLAGDDKYGDTEQNKRFKTLGLKRMFLHARELGFTHPVSGDALRVEAPLDEALQTALQRLQEASR